VEAVILPNMTQLKSSPHPTIGGQKKSSNTKLPFGPLSRDDVQDAKCPHSPIEHLIRRRAPKVVSALAANDGFFQKTHIAS
jgi:hypothetical protein